MKSIVNQSKKILNKRNIFIGILLFFVIILIAIKPAKYSAVAFKGIEIWAKILLPSLLPFFILTKLFASTGVIDSVSKVFSPVTKKLYNCPSVSAYIFLMSVLTGYPVGSKLVQDMYVSKNLSKAEAVRTTAFCSNSGPMFILGSVAIGMFADKKMGIVILISHILGALINGLVYRNYGKKEQMSNCYNLPDVNKIDFSASVVSSINSILLIGGVICFTFVFLEVLTNNVVFDFAITQISKTGINRDLLTALFSGFGEITKGCLMLSSVPLSKLASYCLCTFVISFGGISTFLQARAFLKDIVPTKIFLLQKITHAFFACAICLILCLIGCGG